jgi:hypothetical protein
MKTMYDTMGEVFRLAVHIYCSLLGIVICKNCKYYDFGSAIPRGLQSENQRPQIRLKARKRFDATTN